ncbi:MAG TPA: phosphonate ABC transporter, permease protein PhnE [Candidatus Limiplasma sp.]|nr:phosphonate ABC transporter, permease protein PhnE [Candidatus Limiplasma sp.]HRX09611.1 phosphonate ABC transporter, permease protein PhnE [Candidatus Limiplasma sp.]
MTRKKYKQAKPLLFDRLFPPRTMMVGGHTVQKPRSRAWLISIVLLIVVAASVMITEFDIGILIKRGHQLWVILAKIFNPKWEYFSKVVNPLLDTIKMSVMGSVIGSLLALPFSIIASANIVKNGILVAIMRVLLNIVRTLPTLVIASISALMFGLGTFAGTVAISIFTFGIVSKMMYESIETVDMGAFEAMEALGSTKFRAFWSAVFPQILPTYLSHCLYSFEINIRAASILGYVGAGGLGILINDRVGFRDYEGLGMVLLTLFVVVLIIDNTSQYLRRKLS